MKKTLVIIGTVIGIVILGFAVLRPNNGMQTSNNTQTATPPPLSEQQPGESTEQSIITTIKYSDAGFEPKEIAVKQGTKVQFVNNTQIPMYVATNPHPEHTDYPEFEMGVAMQRHPQPGEDFSFTFEKTGNWSFHNHAIPEHMGTVRVE